MAISFLPIYIEYLGIEAYGLIGLFVVLQSLLLLLDMGITPTLNREMARFNAGDHSPQSIRVLLRSLEIICLLIAILIISTIWLTSSYIATSWLNLDSLSPDIVTQAILIMALIIAFRFGESIYRGALYGLEKQVSYNIMFTVLTTMRYAGAILILSTIANSVLAFFIWQLIISVLSVIVFSYSVHRALPKTSLSVSFSRESIKGIKQFATGMMVITILTAFLLHSDKLLLSNLLPLNEFGYYSLAATASGVLFMMISPVAQAVFPRMVKLSGDDDSKELAGVYHKSTQLIVALTAPAAMIVLFFADGVMFLWSGNDVLSKNTAPILSILIAGCFLLGLAHMPYQLQLAHGWTSLLVKVNGFIVVALVASIYILTPTYGAIGAAWVWLVANAVYVIISSQFMHRKLLLSHKWKWYFEDILLPTLGALFVIVIVSVFYSIENMDRLDWFFMLSVVWLVSTLSAILLSSSLKNWLVSSFSNYARS